MAIDDNKLFIRYLKEKNLYYLYCDAWSVPSLSSVCVGFLCFNTIKSNSPYNKISRSGLYGEFNKIKSLCLK